MGLTKPLVHEIAYKTWLINELGCNNMYVLEGEDRSLVVDALIEVHRQFLRDEAKIEIRPNHLHPELPGRQKITLTYKGYYVEPGVPPRKWKEGEEQIIP